MTQNNPFNPFDLSAYASNFNMESWTESQRKAYENARTANEAIYNSMNRLVQRQNEMMQATLKETVEATRAMSSANGIEAMMNVQNEYARRSTETASKNMEELSGLYQQYTAECSEIYQKAMNETTSMWSQQSTPSKKPAASTAKK